MNSNRPRENSLKVDRATRAAQFEQRVVALKGRSRDERDQGYFDRLQRASSWLAKAYRVPDMSDLESRFIFSWIAVNALYGTPKECLECLIQDEQRLRSLGGRRPPKTEAGVSDLDWFLFQISDLDVEQRILGVLKANWTVVEACATDRFLQRGYWALAPDETLKGFRKRDLERVQRARRGADAYGCLATLFLYRFRILRNQVFHGAATDRYSKRREKDERQFEAQTGLLEQLADACILVLEESGGHRRWPCIPAPRLESPGHRTRPQRPCMLTKSGQGEDVC